MRSPGRRSERLEVASDVKCTHVVLSTDFSQISCSEPKSASQRYRASRSAGDRIVTVVLITVIVLYPAPRAARLEAASDVECIGADNAPARSARPLRKMEGEGKDVKVRMDAASNVGVDMMSILALVVEMCATRTVRQWLVSAVG